MSFPTRVHRSWVWEDLFHRYLDSDDETPFELVLPPPGRIAYNVEVVTSILKMPWDLTLLIMSFYRINRVEKLSVHMMMILEAAWLDEVYWLQRQRNWLRIRYGL